MDQFHVTTSQARCTTLTSLKKRLLCRLFWGWMWSLPIAVPLRYVLSSRFCLITWPLAILRIKPAIQCWALFKDSSSFSFHFLSYPSKWHLQLSIQNKFELCSNFLSKQQKLLLLPQRQIIFAFSRVSISSSKFLIFTLIFNFYSTQAFILLDGNSDVILYNTVIYRIYCNVIFKWNWCDDEVILLYQSIKKTWM